ncbi:MAG TPA: DUF1272 domain-containing protein [Permianibacter sp.]|nr:DUF1272 domain-containing protein [Permianibacter sp.]
MLQMRPSCECCDRPLPADEAGAFICSFECTFCQSCADTMLAGICPNCNGQLLPRPTRAPALLLRYPASSERVYKPAGCTEAAGHRRGDNGH